MQQERQDNLLTSCERRTEVQHGPGKGASYASTPLSATDHPPPAGHGRAQVFTQMPTLPASRRAGQKRSGMARPAARPMPGLRPLVRGKDTTSNRLSQLHAQRQINTRHGLDRGPCCLTIRQVHVAAHNVPNPKVHWNSLLLCSCPWPCPSPSPGLSPCLKMRSG